MTAALPHLFSPVTVGRFTLDHRLVVPPHGGGASNLVGSDDEFETLLAMWLPKATGGFQWIGGTPSHVRNPLPQGFEPSGVGAHGPGHFRHPRYAARIGQFVSRLKNAGATAVTVQMVQQGGKPIAPSATFSAYDDHRIAHALDVDEIEWLVREYGESAALAVDAGGDVIEIHANHDDVVQWFLSPLTNLRTDRYGGSFENRIRYLREITDSIRRHAPRPFTYGLRLCIDELIDGGYGLEECQRLVEAFTADGTVDYFSLDVGNNFGSPSYVPSGWHDDIEWAALCGQVKQATNLPVVYTGRVTSPEQAEAVLAAGHADLVAMARATFADFDIVHKARGTNPVPIRPCIGLNECINRKQVEGLGYACGVNPLWAHEWELRNLPERTSQPQRVLVVGGGPAGMELAGLCSEHGHAVTLWEKGPTLGGLLSVAAMVRANAKYQRWIDWQVGRLERAGVDVRLDREANAADVLNGGFDMVALATGAVPRLPAIPGIDGPGVFPAGAVVKGLATPGPRVAVLAEDDGPAPMSVSDHLAGLGHEVTLAVQTAGPAPLVGKYSIGTMLARLVDGGVRIVPMARATRIADGTLHLSSTYGSREWAEGPFDSVVVVAGGIPNDGLWRELKGRHPSVHVLGDAYAPRRVVWATRQAHALARTLL